MNPKEEFDLIRKGSDKDRKDVCKSNFIYFYGGDVYIPQPKLDYITFFLQCPPYDSNLNEDADYFYIDWEHPKKCKTDGGILSAFLISRYVCLINEIIRSGLKKDYINREENFVAKIKGRLLHKRNLFHNVIPGHKERLYCAYQEYTDDIPINRFHKSVLLLCRQIILDQMDSVLTPRRNPILSSINSSLAFMQNIGAVENLMCCSKTVQSPHGKLFRNYEKCMEIAKMIVRLKEGHFYQTNGNQSFSLPNFWIYLPTMFEHYVYGKLRISTLSTNLKVQPNGYSGQKADFILTSPAMVIDAKFKERYNNNKPDLNDIRELSGYSRDWHYFTSAKDDIPCVIVYPVYTQKKQTHTFLQDDAFHLFDDYAFTSLIRIEELNNFFMVGVQMPVKE